MKDIFELLKYTLPSIVVFLTAYFIIKSFIENETLKRKIDLISSNSKLLTPIRLQAYERVILFLERISPESLIMRIQQPGMSAKQLLVSMLITVRSEFEHNLSQQIYLSSESWEAVKNAKENVIKLLNVAGSRVNENAKSIDLGKIIIEMYISVDNPPIAKAINNIKEEIRDTFITVK